MLAMLCYAMLCYAMLCYATLRYATLRYAMLMLCYERSPLKAIFWQVVPNSFLSFAYFKNVTFDGFEKHPGVPLLRPLAQN